MAKYFVMGNYTAKAFQGFMKDPTQDRSAAVKALTESVGGTFESFAITRGPYDFIAVTSGDMPFENFAGVKLAVEASGTVENMVILEEMDMNKAAEHAAKAMSGYKPAG
ncbi:GYD domain-containing protein [Candidatus Pelagibacter sp.]|jgi:uncharacterized protein with GYD domain|nr:GYD domain-containing protein [Candidatus Pelagibacter bacterium]MDA8866889.1 GYD domain-containing protein [Candidatus Pelagibacter sp.]|tara:strand:- start:368 stop:694 length:327 start_codon:yes stop_codon:yes gene_type:complete